jgi:hypothetical protein
VKPIIKMSLPAFMLFAAAPGFAQDTQSVPDEKVNQVIVYGNDQCPESKDDDVITVCARLAEKERYRIPKSLRDDPNNIRNESFTNKVIAYEHISASGTMSCSPTGAGGFTGCGLGEIDRAYAEKKSDPGLNFGRLIAAERKKRLAGIDAEAAEVEERVKQFEKERAEKEAKQAGEASEVNDPAVDSGALPEPK